MMLINDDDDGDNDDGDDEDDGADASAGADADDDDDQHDHDNDPDYLSERLKPGAPSHMGPARFNAAFMFAISSSESNLNASRGLDNGAPTSGCCGGHRAGRSVDEFARSGPLS